MQTLTEKEFKQRYGTIGVMQFKDEKKEESLFGSIKQDLMNRGETNANLLSKPSQSFGDSALTGLKVAANTAGGISDVAGQSLQRLPVVGGAIKKAGQAISSTFNKATEKLGGTKFFQEAAGGLPEGNRLEKGLEAASAGGEIAGNILGADIGLGAARGAASGARKGAASLGSVPRPDLSGATKNIAGAVRDVVPTAQGFVDNNLAKALDLTPGDLMKIEASTGNPVGRWLADNNLIGTNKMTTEGMIQNFFAENYAQVRNEIGKVKTKYDRTSVPRFEETLKAIYNETQGKLGLEKTNEEILRLMKKDVVSLEDIQRTKELLDEHFSLYKMTGEVGQGVTKEGLANVRKELKDFIEGQVAKETGADIRAMNNNVATAKSLADAIKTRSTRGLTRSNVTWRDAAVGMGLTYFGSPLAGLAAVVVWKVLTSPTARLRMARYVDQLSDAKRLRLSEDIRDGKVPQEVVDIVDEK